MHFLESHFTRMWNGYQRMPLFIFNRLLSFTWESEGRQLGE